MISFIVATIGRPSLANTLASIECWPGDEVIVIGDVKPGGGASLRWVHHARGNDWGHTERNAAMPMARGRYIAHIDDDDVYAPGTRALMADAIEKTPDRPVLFRMQFPNGLVLWQTPELRCGNVGTPMILVPNDPAKLGRFASFVGGDCAFLESCKWAHDEYVWRPEVIALLGHNIGG